jgi:drug/metabolite transporter (DMT)-like permease
MVKKHFFSVHSDLKTGFFCRFSLIIGCLLFSIYLVETLLHPFGFNDDTIGALLAFAILFLGLGLILYFFSYQFTKLSKIAEEVENDTSLMDTEETKEQ